MKQKHHSKKPDFKTIFESAPGLVLVLLPDFTIVAASDAYLKAVSTKRANIMGQAIFDIIPGTRNEEDSIGIANLRASLNRVLKTREADVMAAQNYDIPLSRSKGGGFEERHWTYINSPVLDKDGDIEYIIHAVEDVTAFTLHKQKAAEDLTLFQQLKVSEEKFRMIFETAPDAVITINELGVITAWNPRAESMFGWRHDEVIGKTLTDNIIPERYRDAHKNGIANFLKTGEGPVFSKPIELSALRKNNTEFPVELTVSPSSRIGDKNIFLAFARDITNRKKAQEELMRSNERFLKVFESSSTSMIITDLETNKYQSVNKNFLDDFGYTLEEVIGKTGMDIMLVEPESTTKMVTLMMKQGYFKDLEVLVRKKSGETFWCISSVQIVMINDKKCALCSFHNITDRKKAEDELRHTNAFIDLILENIPNMIFVKDAKELRFLRFNKAGEKLLGYSRHDLLGKNDFDFFPKDQADAFIAKDNEVLKSGELLDIPEEPIMTKAGQVWLHTRKIPITDEKGTPLYLLGISENITQQKILEEKRKETEKLLHQSIQRIKLILENIGEGVIVIDRNANIILSNRMAEEIIGIKQNENVHIPLDWSKVFELFYSDGKTIFPAQYLPLEKGLRGEQTNDVEIIVQERNSGEKKRIKVNGRPVLDESNEIIAAVTTLKDTTQIAELAEELNISAKKYRNLIGFQMQKMD